MTKEQIEEKYKELLVALGELEAKYVFAKTAIMHEINLLNNEYKILKETNE